MFSTRGTKAAALGLLLSGVVVGVAGAQITTRFQRVGSTTTGLFTVAPGEAISFNVALDDDVAGPVGQVQMRLYDDAGNVRKSKLVTLAPGQSATLPWAKPGRYRAQFDVLESAESRSDRREVAGTVEVHGPDDLVARHVCSQNVPTAPSLPIPPPRD